MDVNIPFLAQILTWIKKVVIEPHADSFKDWYAIKKNKRVCKKNRERFAINKRLTEHVIYGDGTLILHMKYYIEMLRDGNFVIKKWYRRVSENTDLTKIGNIYKSFYEVPKTKNRFKNYLIVCELQDDVKRKTSKFFPEIIQVTDEQLDYQIVYENLKKGDLFTFCISITIPKEFANSSVDIMSIGYNYGVYKFISKIDKQHPHARDFSPKFGYATGSFTPSYAGNIYYEAFEWTVRNPIIESKIELRVN